MNNELPPPAGDTHSQITNQQIIPPSLKFRAGEANQQINKSTNQQINKSTNHQILLLIHSLAFTNASTQGLISSLFRSEG
jgi:hypothetical protein